MALLLSCMHMKKRQLARALLIVQPATLAGWHQAIVGRHWTYRQQRRPSRPRTGPETERLVLRIARENPKWGYGKIAGEMRKLGYKRFGRSTVKRILERHGAIAGLPRAGASAGTHRAELARFPLALRPVHLGLRLLHRDDSNAAHLLRPLLHRDRHAQDRALECVRASGRRLGPNPKVVRNHYLDECWWCGTAY